jgi:hypothetical protein
MGYKAIKLIALFEKIKEEKIFLPDFQRDYVWDRAMQSLLTASLMNKIPMGAFLTSNLKSKVYCRSLGLINYTAGNYQGDMLLDGQQRLTTLFNVFNDIYDFYNKTLTLSHIDIYDNYVFNELKSRWFLRVNSSFIGIEYFNMADNLSTIEVNEAILNKQDLKTTVHGYGPKISERELITYCNNQELIPLFLVVSNMRFIQEVLLNLARLHGANIVLSYDDEKLENLRKIHFPNMPFQEFKTGIISGTFLDLMKIKWISKVTSFLTSLIDSEQFVIHLEDISKVTEAFNYLNRGGVKLSNFDLFCSKFSESKLRVSSVEHVSNYSVKINKNREICEIFLRDTTVFNKELDSQFSEFLVHVFSMYHFKVEHPYDEIFDLSVLKSRYSLDKISNDFLNKKVIEKVLDIASRVVAVNYLCFGFKGVDKIPNKLALIPIAWLIIKRDLDLENDKNVNLICAHYYTTIFSLYYDSHQNENCVKASKELIDLFDRNLTVLNKFKTMVNELFTVCLRKEVLLLQGEDYISKSVETNLFNFYLCREHRGIVDFSSTVQRINYASEREIHHIIPLNSASKIKQSTKELRRNKLNRLNSILNRTPISKIANRDLSDMAVNTYMAELSTIFSLIKVGHLIPDDYKSFQLNGILKNAYDPNDPLHVKLDKLYTQRYNDIKATTEELLLTWLG